jgi:hypothetical protein
MPNSSEGTLGHPRAAGAAGLVAVLLLVAGLPVQAAFTARTADTALTARHEHDIRDLMLAAADHIPDGARYAVTSEARTPNAVYTIRRATVAQVDLIGAAPAVYERLEQAGVGFVIVLYRNRPPAFAPPDPRWYRLLASVTAGQVVQLTDG